MWGQVLERRLDELIALQRRVTQARYVQAWEETMRCGQEALHGVEGKRRRGWVVAGGAAVD
ncbi:MAG: hypothetical protein HPY69_03905 [Armatimonadetes bacterium]|nr:hypothetical protein [Armatimonadota bacterium]